MRYQRHAASPDPPAPQARLCWKRFPCALTPGQRRIDLAEIFLLVQRQMLACLQLGGAFEHPGASGAATEQRWIDLFNCYLPRRYRASPAFVVDSDGRRSRQVDLAIYDNLYSPLLFPHDSGVHIAAESVYAVFEIKQTLTRQLLRALRRTTVPVISGGASRAVIEPSPILGGVLAFRSVWSDSVFDRRITAALKSLTGPARLDLGCVLNRQRSKVARPQVSLQRAERSSDLLRAPPVRAPARPGHSARGGFDAVRPVARFIPRRGVKLSVHGL